LDGEGGGLLQGIFQDLAKIYVSFSSSFFQALEDKVNSARVRRGGGRLGFSPYSVFKEKKRGEEEIMPFWSNSN
jgi:hypothetical protein